MRSTIAETIRNFTLDDYRPIHPRELDLGDPLPPRAGNAATIITGMRRSGKTYRLFQEMDALHRAGVPWERMLYFNFEDDRLFPVTPETGDAVLDAFYSLHPEALEQGAYFFLDELQEMENWGAWMRRVIDTRKTTIYVSGSSSKMLSSEVATEFRGRSVEFELLPLSFSEYISFRDPSLTASSPHFSTAQRLALQSLLESYLVEGGFPAIQGRSRQRSVLTLQGYVERVVARDVVERHNIGNPRVAALFARRALAANGRMLSLRKIERDFKSQGIPVSRALLSDLLTYFEEAFLLAPVKEFTRSLSESTTALPKIYAIDPGLVCANSPASTQDDGQRLEDAVYLELRRRSFGGRRNTISFLKTAQNDYEIDFIVGDALFQEGYGLYQVSQTIDDEKTLDRELRALWEAMEEYRLNEGTLIVQYSAEQAFERDGKTITCIPAWKWLLER